MDEVDKIILMGGLIPSDKLLLVQCLKKKGHTVAMVGVSSNVIPALKEADVRITIQTCSSEMVRESCNLIIMDGNLGVLVSLVRCGRCIYDNICKYMQLELTMNIAGLLITFITTTIFGHSPITTIQLAWANFVVTLLGGLGLLTEPPSKKLMEKPPLRQTEPLINMTMWTNVVIEALYQSGVSVTWQFKGQTMIGINKEVAFIEITHILAVLAYARLTLLQWFICRSVGMVSCKSSRNEVLESQKTVSPGGDESEKGSLFPVASSSISSYSNISLDDTGAVSGGHGGDLESQQTVLSMASIALGADKADKGSLAVDKISSWTSNISQDDSGEAAMKISNNCIGDAKLQQANVAGMVQEDLDSMQKVGGIQEIAEALDTDLEKGIFPGLELDLCSQRIANTLSPTTQAPARGCFKSLLKACNDWIIILLCVYAMLLLGFGIVMKSPKDWHIGVITILFIMVLVVLHSLRKLWLERSRQMSRRQNTSEMHQVEVEVIRGGSSQKVSISDVLLGDIVCLERGSLVPADGLLVSGEYIKLDDDLDSTINNENPFLFYGPKVIDGKGRMLVTSVGMNTTLGDLLNKVTYGPLNKTPLPVQLDKLNTSIQITGLLLSILNLVVLFFHFMLQKKRFHFNLPDLKGKAVASKEIMDTSKKILLTPNGKFNTLSTSILTFLFGVTEGIPFVVTLAIGYWNKKMLFGKAIVQEPLACLTMNSVTTVCIDKSGWRSVNSEAADSTKREIEAWINAGVNIILVSEDDVSILEDIACKCGLLPNADKLKLEAKDFQNYINEKQMDEVDKIILMGSLIPSDKLLLVQCLKKKGHTVAMVGIKTNVIPALKEADVGITIQTFSSEMVRKSSDIIIVAGNLSFLDSLVTLVRCGRCIYDNIRKYMQVELTMNISGLLITFITTTIYGYSPITTIQLVWVNFFVTLLGGLGLLTEPPSKKLMEKPPLRKTEPLINMTMWTNVVIQALYQSGVSVTWQFKWQTMIGINKEVSNTIIFNSFVLCQVCNIINARQVKKMTVVEHFPRNPLFWLAVGVILLLQVAFIEITHILAVLAYARLTLLQWFICLSVGMVSWVINCLLIGLQSACTS
ncbi:putative calcium-transporting ATPase 13, plasma membrane-type [Quercus robur]|uniref:putative calcium-transporting ATPase 13, plasma membrane-type n=1 Tax=Quercus robur TaxID=38942 RepID=UPI00216122AC|nr:putative calcium-transporting ATPase 13, plasma membrane-type [Quercus robur]